MVAPSVKEPAVHCRWCCRCYGGAVARVCWAWWIPSMVNRYIGHAMLAGESRGSPDSNTHQSPWWTKAALWSSHGWSSLHRGERGQSGQSGGQKDFKMEKILLAYFRRDQKLRECDCGWCDMMSFWCFFFALNHFCCKEHVSRNGSFPRERYCKCSYRWC